jgi:hypothetical protein
MTDLTIIVPANRRAEILALLRVLAKLCGFVIAEDLVIPD